MPSSFRWIPAITALCLAAGCSDSSPLTAPAGRPAEASVASCESELNALQSVIEGASFTGRKAATDEAGLLGKVAEARAKLAEGKPTDAVRKLEDIRTAVTALSTPDAGGKTKLDPADATRIVAAVEAAERCVQPAS
jgi:hypothetical protein